MSHAEHTKQDISHDSLSSNTDQSAPFIMASRMGNMMDHDTQVYYFKYFRQFWASGPAAAVAVVAGVCVV